MPTIRILLILVMFLFPATWLLADDNPNSETLERFQVFLEQSLKKQPVGEKEVEAFYEHSFTFWNKHLQDCMDHPGRYQPLLTLYHQNQALYPLDALLTDIDRFKPEIDTFKRFDARNTVPANSVLFVGSSSIVFWETALAFPSFPVINRGFGGSTLVEVNHFYADIVKKYKPAIIVLYCDSDIFMGKAPSAALQLFHEFSDRVAQDFPSTKILFLSMKPTLMDDFAGRDVRSNEAIANKLIRDYIEAQKNMRFVDVATPMFQGGTLRTDIFLPDAVHLNARGYSIWNPIIEKQLSALYAQFKAQKRPAGNSQ